MLSNSCTMQCLLRDLFSIFWIGLCLASEFNIFDDNDDSINQKTSGWNESSKRNVNQRLSALGSITEPYQKEALKLVIQEANQVARELRLTENLPITETNLVTSFILPYAGAQAWKTIGKVVTRNYAYYVSRDNKFSYLEGTHQQEDRRRWHSEYWWPVNRMDTNAVYQMATQSLAAVSMDVEGLNRDCRLHIDAYTPQGLGKGAHFMPVYTVYWTKGRKGEGSTASVQLFAPTKTILQLRVEDPRYILRQPITVTNVGALFLKQVNEKI